jgi:hypothetical protein
MGSTSESPTRHRLRIELWSWSAWLVLAIVSYPALLLIWVAPRAGLLSGLIAGLLVAYTASLGYSGRRELEHWFAATALSGVAAAVVGAIAFYGDRAAAQTAVLCGLIAAAVMIFAWNFLPWLVRDADAPEPSPTTQSFLSRGSRRQEPVRAALGLVLMLALLALGLGSAWSKGEARVPNPTAWIVALGVLCLAFMFVERMAFFERVAREGNLLMAPGSYRSWLGVALAVLLVAAALAAALPLRRAKEAKEASRVGSAAAASAARSAGEKLGEAAERLASAARNAAAGASGMPRAMFPLLLLLLLLLLALMLIWGFRRSRAARWLVRVMTAVLAAIARAWMRLGNLLGRRQAPALQGMAIGPQTDPLRDIFAQPDELAGLTAREIAIRTYHLLLSFAEMLGHGRRHGQTPFEYARALEQAAPSAAESVRALTWAYSGAMYGGESASVPDPSSVRDSWQRIRSTLAGGMTEEELALRKRAYLAARHSGQGR